MESVLTQEVPFDLDQQAANFRRVFSAINAKLGETAFVKFRGTSPVGGLAPAYFEAVALGAAAVIDEFEMKEPESVRGNLIELVQSEDFREVTGPGANNRTKLKRRIELVKDSVVAA
jgi:hypothetical protein